MKEKCTGTCTSCGKTNVEITILDDVEHLCIECLDYSYQECDICHEYYDYGIVDYFLLKDGRYICEYCSEDFDPEDFDEDND